MLIGLILSAQATASTEQAVGALVPFEDLTGRPGSAYLAGVIHQSLYPALDRTQAWRLVERDQLAALLRESDLKASGATGRQARIAGADVMILGDYRDEEGVVTVSARLVDAVTGDIIREAHWSGHVSGLCDAMPPRVAAALAGAPPPTDDLPPKMIARFHRACRHLECGRVDEAIEVCNTILEDHRRDVPTLLLRGYAGLRKKGWTRYAVQDFEKVLELDEGNLAARLGLARAKLTGDRRTIEQAVPWLREVLESHPDHGEACWLLARAFEALGRMTEASKAAQQAVEALPDFGPAWQTLAKLRMAQNQLTEALKAAIRASECDTNDPAAWMLLGDVQAAGKHFNRARVSFERALRCDPPPAMKKMLNARLRKYD